MNLKLLVLYTIIFGIGFMIRALWCIRRGLLLEGDRWIFLGVFPCALVLACTCLFLLLP